MDVIGLILTAALVASIFWAIVGFVLSKKIHLKFGLIAACTFAGMVALWPPKEKAPRTSR